MSAVAIMRALVVAHAPVTALVSPARILAGDVPQGSLPAIGIREISGIEQDTVARQGNSLVTARVQVTVYAASYPQQKAIIKAGSDEFFVTGVSSDTTTGEKKMVRKTVMPRSFWLTRMASVEPRSETSTR